MAGDLATACPILPSLSPNCGIGDAAYNTRASSVGGRSRPSAFAVVRLITKSNLVGCSIGSIALGSWSLPNQALAARQLPLQMLGSRDVCVAGSALWRSSPNSFLRDGCSRRLAGSKRHDFQFVSFKCDYKVGKPFPGWGIDHHQIRHLQTTPLDIELKKDR